MTKPPGLVVACFLVITLMIGDLILLGFSVLFLLVTSQGGINFGPPRQGWIEPADLVAVVALSTVIAWSGVTLRQIASHRERGRRFMVLLGGAYLGLSAIVTAWVAYADVNSPVVQGRPSPVMRTLLELLQAPMGWVICTVAGLGFWFMVYFQLESTKTFFRVACETDASAV